MVFGVALKRSFSALLVLVSLISVRAEPYQRTGNGIRLVVGKAQVELAVATPSAFRLSISYEGKMGPLPTTFLVKSKMSAWDVVQSGTTVGIKSSAGELAIDPTTGKWTLKDHDGATVIPESGLGTMDQGDPASPSRAVIHLPVQWKPGLPLEAYGCGNGKASLQQNEAVARVGDGTSVTPYFWSPSGYAALAITEDENAPASWKGAADHSSLTWQFPGKTADLYLTPGASLYAAAQAYGELTGLPPVPPRWAFGYLQSRWGWKDRAYIEEVLRQFHDRHIPLDAIICDFEWYTAHPDYNVPPGGEAGFTDFGWNPLLFPEPGAQLEALTEQGVHFVGIRKPRMGNDQTLKLMREKGWLLKPAIGTKYQTRDLKFADADLRAWYSDQSRDLLKTNISGWWNDEGESAFSTYYHWNEGELDAFARDKPGQRFWSLNRAFSPGLQRLGAAVWNGDIKASWASLVRTPTDLLNWGLAGMPYGACDIGGFWNPTTPELLTRWMEAGVFFPVMRTHSTLNVTPHFPWLFGPKAEAAMTKAIELRYRLIPYYYSLAYDAHNSGAPLMRPLLMEFPDDPKVSNLSDEWLMGSRLLAAPILQKGGRRSIYLPQDNWFQWGTSTRIEGSKTFTIKKSLAEIPVYIRAGTILPLGPEIANTAQMPGGPLEVQIYPGRNATFTLVEDDGATLEYLEGKTRGTRFKWNDASRTLTWTVEGNYGGPSCFQKMDAVLFDPEKGRDVKTMSAPLGAAGTISFSP